MRIICVDDEELILNLVVYMCSQMPQIDEVKGFLNPLEALDYLENNKADIAILDIDMPGINGISLAVKIKEKYSDISIIFLTGYSNYALDAFRIHASGYVMKPIERERLENEIQYALRPEPKTKYPHVFAKTFGVFDFLIDGKSVHFERSKSKELLAFLIDKQGSGAKRAEAFSALYENKIYDRKMQNQFNVIVHNLKTTLEENSAGDIFEMKSGELRVNAGLFDCDLYRLLEGDTGTVNTYRGEYMSTYHWASITEAFIDMSLNKGGFQRFPK